MLKLVEKCVHINKTHEYGACDIISVQKENGEVWYVIYCYDMCDSLGAIDIVSKVEGGELNGFEFSVHSINDVFDSSELEWLWEMKWQQETAE